MAAVIQGSKGGSKKPKQPYIAPDSIRSVSTAKLLYALSEGEIKGLVNGHRSVYLEGTPVLDDAGNSNFTGVQVDFRTGTVNQSYLQGFPETSNEISVGVELRSAVPWVRAINNPELSAVRVRLSWPQLLQQKTNGDVVGYRIQYAIDVAVDGGAYQEVINAAVNDKVSSKYERSHRVDLPEGSSWMLRVRRLTPNKDSTLISDTMAIDAIAEVIDAKLRYPHTAVLALQYDSDHFQSIAKFSAEVEGRIIQVPSNYDPETRSYTGVWDGTFKQAYSNNPAWVWYDLVLHPRYGLGQRINASMVNKWRLYQIAQYCDVMVPDGKGGTEPRYACNLYLQSRKQAYVALVEIASIFHGASFWNGSQMTVNADMPADAIYTYTRANIIGGMIEYAGSPLRNRHNVAMVAWDDPEQNYKTMYEPVSDDKSMLRGMYQLDIGVIGCTSQGQAQRAGKWAFLSEQLETRTATFRVGLDGQIPEPGHIINVADELLQGRPNGGRIAAANANSITLDRDTGIKAGDRLVVNLPSGRSEARVVKTIEYLSGRMAGATSWYSGSVVVFAGESGDAGRRVILAAPFSEIPEPESVWAIDSDDLAVMQYRVTSVKRVEQHQFEISGVLHVAGKFPAIDTGAMVEAPPISVIPPGVQAPPTNVRITQSSMIEQTLAVTTMTVAWDAVEGAVAYEIEWRKDEAEWIRLPRTGSTSIDVRGVYTGQYLARVRAINAIGVLSLPATSSLTEITGKAGAPPALAYLNTTPLVFGIALNWGFLPGSEDALRTELEVSESAGGEDASKLGDFAYPINTHSINGLSAGKRFWFRGRIIDRTGNQGPWSGWADGRSSTDVSEYEEYFRDKIGQSALGQELQAEIGKISGVGPGSVNDRLDSLNAILEAQIEALEAQVADIIGAPDWTPDDAYLAGSLVKDGGALYRAIVDVPTGTPTSSTAYWEKIGDYDSLGELVAALAVRMTTAEIEINELTGDVTSQGQAITLVQAGLAATNQQVDAAQSAAQAAADLAGSKGKVIVQDATPNTADRLPQNLWIDTTGGANTPKRWIDGSWVAVTDKVATDAAAAANQALNELATKADASAVQQLDARVTQQGNTITAQGQSITQIKSQVTDVEADLEGQGQAIDSLSTRVTSTEEGLSVVSEKVDGVFAQINPPMAGETDWYAGSTGVLAGVWSEQSARAEADLALSVRIDATVAQVGDNSAAIFAETEARVTADAAMASQIENISATVGDNSAAIQSEATARANADSALAQQINTVQAAAGSNTAAIQQTNQAVADLESGASAMWNVKLQVNSNGEYVFAGIGLGIENVGGVLQSQFLIEAHRFALLNTINGVLTTPFVVEGGQVFMNSAVIKQADIMNLIVTGVLQSPDYVPETSGMRLNFVTGEFEMNNSVQGEGRTVTSNLGTSVYDKNNVLRVRLGKQ